MANPPVVILNSACLTHSCYPALYYCHQELKSLIADGWGSRLEMDTQASPWEAPQGATSRAPCKLFLGVTFCYRHIRYVKSWNYIFILGVNKDHCHRIVRTCLQSESPLLQGGLISMCCLETAHQSWELTRVTELTGDRMCVWIV